MIQPPSPYLYQTQPWQQFWLKTHDEQHQCFEVVAIRTSSDGLKSLSMRGLVYLYQWGFGQNLMHIPGGPYIDEAKGYDLQSMNETEKEDCAQLLIDFLHKIFDIAKDNQVVALRLNCDPVVASILGIDTSTDLIEFFTSRKIQSTVGLPVPTKARLMFPSIALIDTQSLSKRESNKSLSLESLKTLMKSDKDFWLQVSETTRKQSRRSLNTNVILETQITPESVTVAYELMKSTSSRQNFSLPALDYFLALSQEDFFHLLLIQDEQGVTHTAWLGLIHNNTLTNQYAGNDQFGFKNFWPNLSHVYGLYLARQLKCANYDLGGYERDSDQSRFKDGYKPQIVDFVGGIDLVYLPWYYRIIELGGKSKRILKK